jgi:hypothetical protein
MNAATCLHFNGTRGNTFCRAGVAYESVIAEPERVMGKLLRLPCHKELPWPRPSEGQLAEFAKRGTCAKFQAPTEAELLAHETEIERLSRHTTAARAAIIAKADGKRGVRGAIPCPVCGKWLAYEIQSNGHVHARCQTPACLNWLE